MENLIIRSATIDDLLNIQKLNKILFELEYNNFDSALDTSWPMSNEGEEYFKNAIKFYKNCGFAPSGLTLKQNID